MHFSQYKVPFLHFAPLCSIGLLDLNIITGHKCAAECHDKYTCVEGHHHHVTCTCHNNAYCDHNVHCTEKCPYGGQNLCLGNKCTCHCQSDSECDGCPDIGVCHQNECRCTGKAWNLYNVHGCKY